MVAPASPIPADELAVFRRALVDYARRLGADLDRLDTETDNESMAPLANHPAEGGSDAQDHDIVGREAVTAGELRRLVLRALDKIDAARPLPFGVCELTGQPIERERLALMPWTPFARAGIERMEREGIALADALVPA